MHIEDKVSLYYNIAFSVDFFQICNNTIADNPTAVFTGVKEFDPISDNKGVIIGDISGYANIISLSSVHIDIDFILVCVTFFTYLHAMHIGK